MKEKWGRRVLLGLVWAIMNYASVHLQPLLKTDVGLIKLLVETSGWVAVVIVLGLSGTDVVTSISETKKTMPNGR